MDLAWGPYSESPQSNFNGYRKIKMIGQGGFGKVYLVTKGGQRYALKEIMQEAESEKEVQILKKLRHRNIVTYVESFSGGLNRLYIVMEYCEMGNLDDLINSQSQIAVEERFIIGIMKQVCRGMEYIHSKKVIHRDIKPTNIFVQRGGIIKIGDFGLSKVLHGYARGRCGTPGHISPECDRGSQYSFSSDMWAVGVVLSALCRKKGIQEYSRDLRALLEKLMSNEPRKRPTAAEALSLLLNVDSTTKGRHLSRTAIPNGYSKDLRNLLGKLQTDPRYEPTPDDIRTVFLNLKSTSSESLSSESGYDAFGPKYVSLDAPLESSSSESRNDTLGMEMMSLNAPGMFLGGHPFLGGGAFAGNYIPAFHHPVVYRPNIPTLDTPAQFFMQRNPTSNIFLGGHQLYRTSSIPGRIYPIEPAIDPGAVVLAEFDHPSSFRGPIA